MNTKKFFAVLFLIAWPLYAGGATEYLRPTADANSTSSGCATGTDVTSSSMSAVYTGKSGAGPTGSSATNSTGSQSATEYSARLFSSWQTTSKTYTALTINVSNACTITGAGIGHCWILYSLNSGSTWTTLINPTSTTSQVTSTASISTSTALSNLQILVCSGTTTGGGSVTPTTTAYDIWTAGTPTSKGNKYGYIM